MNTHYKTLDQSVNENIGKVYFIPSENGFKKKIVLWF